MQRNSQRQKVFIKDEREVYKSCVRSAMFEKNRKSDDSSDVWCDTQSLPSPRETLIMCPPFLPWTTTHFTVSPLISDCTGISTARLQSASNRLSSLPPSDIQVWTVGSFPSLFGPGGAGVYVTLGHIKIPLFFPNMNINIAIREDIRENASVKKSGNFVKYSRCNSTFKF